MTARLALLVEASGPSRIGTDFRELVLAAGETVIGGADGPEAIALASRVVSVSAAAGDEDTHKRVVSIQVKDLQGNNLAASKILHLMAFGAFDETFAFSAEGAGSILVEGNGQGVIQTDATGLAEIGVTDEAAETVLLGIGAGPGSPAVEGTTVLLVFAG